MVRIVVIILMIVTAIVTSVVYHVTHKADIEYLEGHHLFEKGEYSKAEPFFKQSLLINPSHKASLKDLAYSYQWTGRESEAIDIFRRLLAITPNDNKIKRSLAQTLSWKRIYAEAAALLREVISSARDSDAAIELAEIYEWQGEFGKSLEILKGLPKEELISAKSRLIYAKALLYSNEPFAASEILKTLAADKDLSADKKTRDEVAELLAEASMMEKDYPSAIERRRKILEDNPGDIKSRILLADMLSWVKCYEEAITEYETLLKMDPENIEIKVKLARIYSWVKDYKRSEALLKEIMLTRPDDVDSIKLLADILSWQKRYEEAIPLYEKALKLCPDDIETMNKLADAASWSKNYERAERLYGDIILKNPGDAGAVRSLAAILSWQKKYDLSIEEYEKLIIMRPGDTENKIDLAKVYSWSGRYDKAEALYREIVADNPSDMASRIALGELMMWQNKHREAADYLKALLAERDDPSIKMMYGKVLLYSAEYEKSRDIFDALLKKDPDNRQAKELLADSYAYDKKFKRAIDIYLELLDEGYDRQVKRKLAGTLSWNKEYGRSIVVYDELLREEEDGVVRIQKARVLGWARRYDESLKEYGLITDEKLKPAAKLEMNAKRAYWNDRVGTAISRYSEILKTDPKNSEAGFDLSQIYSYQSMWQKAIREYRGIIDNDGGHFRAREGLKKALLISENLAWEMGYDFVESDSQSRDMDIRKRTIFNKFAGYVKPGVLMEGTYNFGTRAFSDFSNVMENEGKIKVSYMNNPGGWASAFYDLIVYNKDIAPMNTFGGELGFRVFDSTKLVISYNRERLQNSSNVIRWRDYEDDLKARAELSVNQRFKIGADYTYAHYSDRNFRNEPGFDALYYFSLDPLRFSVKYRYFYREFDDKTPDYFSPKGFTTNALFFNWRHFLNKEEIFFGSDDIYYDLGYNVSLDSETIAGHTFSGQIHWDINKRLSLDVKGYFTKSSNRVYKDEGLTAKVKYYF